MLVGRCAERAGFRGAEARNLEQLDAVFAAEMPHLVVLDLNLGRVRPSALFERLASHRPTAPMLPLSGLRGQELDDLLAQGRAAGLNMLDPVAKPIGLGELTAILRQHLP